MTAKKLNLAELKREIPKMYVTKAAKHFGVSYPTIRGIAARLGLEFKEYKPAGRKKIELI